MPISLNIEIPAIVSMIAGAVMYTVELAIQIKPHGRWFLDQMSLSPAITRRDPVPIAATRRITLPNASNVKPRASSRNT